MARLTIRQRRMPSMSLLVDWPLQRADRAVVRKAGFDSQIKAWELCDKLLLIVLIHTTCISRQTGN